MESMLHVNIPVQMIACTDTDGRITPIRFRFRDKTGELVTVTIDRVLTEDQKKSSMGVTFSCQAVVYGIRKTFTLWYSYFAHDWHLSRLQI